MEHEYELLKSNIDVLNIDKHTLIQKLELNNRSVRYMLITFILKLLF